MATFRKENPNVEEQEEQNYLTGYGIVPLGPTGVIRGGGRCVGCYLHVCQVYMKLILIQMQVT